MSDEHSKGLLHRIQILLNSQHEVFPYRVCLGTVELEVCKGVFSPKYFESSPLLADIFPYASGDTLLDVGCGTGILMIRALLNGADYALGVDISAAAVANAKRNLARHNLCAKAEVLKSDLFSKVKNRRFRTVLWNAPWIYLPPSTRLKRILDLSIFDPGYRTLDQFFKCAWNFLEPDGRLLIGLGDFHDKEQMNLVLKQNSIRLHELVSRAGSIGTYSWYEVVRIPKDAQGLAAKCCKNSGAVSCPS